MQDTSRRKLWMGLTICVTLMTAARAQAQDVSDCVVEEMTFQISPNRMADFIRHDADIWTATLSKQPGFLSKHVWTSRKQPDRIRLVIRWKTKEDWNNVPPSVLRQADQRFNAAMGGGQDFNLLEVKAIDQKWVPRKTNKRKRSS